MSYRVDEITTYKTTVICDNCGTERMLADKELGFDQRMNGALQHGYSYHNVNGTFQNYCPKCKER